MIPFEFKNLPVKGKLIVLIVSISAIAVLVATGVFVAQEIMMHRRTAVNDLELVAEVIGANSAPALSFQDVGAAQEVLASLEKMPDVAYACVYDKQGHVFSERTGVGYDKANPPPAPRPDPADSAFRDGYLIVCREIRGDEGRLGTVLLQSAPSQLRMVVRTALLVFPVMVMLGILIAFGLSSWLSKMICSPILELAGVARTISGAKDYSMRGARRGNDEIGSLVDAFNGMLDEIQRRDYDLRSLNESLEVRVQERTLGLEREVHERELAEEKLTLYTAQLERSNRELQDFAYVASHDLQEPLRKIQAFGDRLMSTCGPSLGERGKDYLVRMQNAAKRMSSLISELLNFSRISSRAAETKPVDLARIVREVLGDLEVKLAETRGSVRVGPLPVIDADPLQMRQLFQNLIGNSLKYHREGVAPLITIEASAKVGSVGNRAEGVCEIVMRDNGIGFDQKHAERIFGLFQRLHGRDQFEGVGMGLAICRRIIERHNGSIAATGFPGEGASFRIVLPLRDVTRSV